MDNGKAKRTLATCSGVHMLHDGMVDMLYALLPILAEVFGLSYAQVGLVRAANRTATASFQIPAGLLAERLGERGLLALGTVIAGAAFLLLAAADGFAAILGMVFLAGVGAAVQHPLSSTLITGAYPPQGRRAALGAYNACGDVGKFVLMGITILATGTGLSWQAPVLAFGVLAILAGGAVLVLLSRAGAGGRPPRAATAPGSAPAGWGIRNRAGFAALAAIATLDNATRVGFLTFVAFLMIGKGVETEWAALAVLVTLFGGMCGKFACGLMAERIGIVRTIALTELLTGGGIILVAAAPYLYAFFLLPVVGVFLNGTSSAIYGTVGDLIEDGRHARAFGLIYTLGSCCGVVAPIAYGMLADFAGVAASVTVAGATVLLTLPLCLVLKPSLAAAARMQA